MTSPSRDHAQGEEPKSKFNIAVKAGRILDYVTTVTAKAPKTTQYNLGAQMRNLACDILREVMQANAIDLFGEDGHAEMVVRRREIQRNILGDLATLDMMAENMLNHKYILQRQFVYMTKLTFALSDSVSRWIASDKARLRRNAETITL